MSLKSRNKQSLADVSMIRGHKSEQKRQRAEAMRARRLAGEPLEAIAKDYGMSRQAVWNIIHRYETSMGLKHVVHRSVPHFSDRQRAEDMYARHLRGDTLEAIAKDNGRTKQAVQQLLSRYEKRTGTEPAVAGTKRQRAKRDAAILKLEAEGRTQAEIAAELNLTRGVVSHALLRQRGRIRHKSRNVDEYTVAIWREMIDAGATQMQIASQTGYKQGSVSNALSRKKEIDNG